MEGIPILEDLVVILATAIVVILLSHRVRVPPLIGLLLTGVLIGPSGLALVSEHEKVAVLAEIGVVALLFSIGLEFSLDRLRQIRRAFFVGGGAQSALTISITVAAASAIGFGVSRSLFIGFLVTLSSTAIVLKLMGDRNDLDSPHGRMVLGILLFQDFMVVPMIVITPVLGGATGTPSAIAVRFAIGVAAVAVVFVTARYLMPRLLRLLVQTGIRELFVLGSVFACLGMALVTESFHFSLALGAFIAGLIISESEYSHQVVADILPFRDVFNSIFFISIGMLLRLDFLFGNLASVLGGAAGLILFKGFVIFAIVRLMKYPMRTALLTGGALAQVGEFSFVVANVGMQYALLSDLLYQIFIAAAVTTMMATPLLVLLTSRLSEQLADRDESGRGTEPSARQRHVIIAGFGVNGKNLARVLRDVHIAYVVVELDGTKIEDASSSEEPMIFGDVTRRDVLDRCDVRSAAAIVLAISDPIAVRHSVSLARQMNPNLFILVRTRHVSEIDALVDRGADHVLAEEFETSIEILTQVLRRYHIPTNVIQAQRRVLRGDHYQVLREPAFAPGVSESVLRILAEGGTDVFFVRDESACVGRTVGEASVRERTGATIIAIVRSGVANTNPESDLTFESGDFVVLMGGHVELDEAYRILAVGDETTIDDDSNQFA